LSERLKSYFPRLPILLLRDGLYANGPVMQQTLSETHQNKLFIMMYLSGSTINLQ
jgi:hypothetical protein